MKKKIILRILFIVIVIVIIGGGVITYMFNMPHRNIQATTADFTLTSADLVQEYLADYKLANQKYLQEEGESKVLLVSGTIASIDEDMNNQKVILLKSSGDKAGVNCTFLKSATIKVNALKVGDSIQVKGVIRSGANYDEDLEMYEDVILDKCDIINN